VVRLGKRTIGESLQIPPDNFERQLLGLYPSINRKFRRVHFLTTVLRILKLKYFREVNRGRSMFRKAPPNERPSLSVLDCTMAQPFHQQATSTSTTCQTYYSTSQDARVFLSRSRWVWGDL
jgi:hypothetical protein